MAWAWSDAVERYKSVGVALLVVFLLLVFNIFGLLIYFIIRPRFTREEEYWDDLERRFLKYEAQGLGDCPRCGAEIQPSYVYCPECGKALRIKCKNCDMYLERSWKICPFCGESQRKDKKNEIKNPKVTNIKTESNKKILRWGKKIDKFIRSVGRVVNDFGRRSDSDKNLSESKSSKTQSKSKRK
jgi:RNA polymerase subunit RPABC4/transcription elongation factor Spt4